MFLNIPLMLNINEKAFCTFSGEHPYGSDYLLILIYVDFNFGKNQKNIVIIQVKGYLCYYTHLPDVLYNYMVIIETNELAEYYEGWPSRV